MKNFRAIGAAFLLTAACVFSGLTGIVSAATSSGNGMQVSPVRTDLVIQPGQSKTVSVYVQNVTNGEENLQVITNDFVAKDETGAPSLLLNGSANPRHGLKQYISTPRTVIVPQGQRKEVKVTVTIPKDAAGGGYYGAVRFAPVGSSASEAKNVALSGSVGSLILVSVPGDIKENMQIASVEVSKGNSAGTVFMSGKGLSAVVRFRNEGNVQEQPFGKFLLKKGSKTLGTYEINNTDPKGNVLPDSIRKFSVDLKDVGSFGKYTVQGNFGYGSNGQLLSASTSFYVIPLYIIIPAVIIIGLIIAAIVFVPKFLKNHDQRVLRRAGRR